MDSRKLRDSSTESSDGASDNAGATRQVSSEESSSSTESSSSEAETERGLPVASQPKEVLQTKVQGASSPLPVNVKTGKESQSKKRIRRDESGQESPAKRKRPPKKSDSPIKVEPLGQEDVLKGNEEKYPAKKNSVGKDEGKPSKQTVREAADPSSSVKDLSQKFRKQISQEAAVKDSTQKPERKAQHTWSKKDEMVFANALLLFSKQGIDIHKNMTQIQQNIKDSMEFEHTRVQLADKLKTLKRKYRNVVDKMKEGGFKENSFPFKNSHEEDLFKISNQLWMEKSAAGEGLDVEEILPKEAGSAAKRKVLAQVADGAVADNGDLKKLDDNRDFISEFRDNCKTTREAVQAEMSALAGFFETQLKAVKDRVQRGIRPSLVSFVANNELMDGIYSIKEIPSSDSAKTEALDQKWRKQRIAEMEVFARRLDLLQEESEVCLEGLRSHAGHGKP